MSALRKGDFSSRKFYGSRNIKTYPAEKIYEEAAFIAYYMHWSHDDIMQFPHLERIKWCNRISAINRRLSNEPDNVFKI